MRGNYMMINDNYAVIFRQECPTVPLASDPILESWFHKCFLPSSMKKKFAEYPSLLLCVANNFGYHLLMNYWFMILQPMEFRYPNQKDQICCRDWIDGWYLLRDRSPNWKKVLGSRLESCKDAGWSLTATPTKLATFLIFRCAAASL